MPAVMERQNKPLARAYLIHSLTEELAIKLDTPPYLGAVLITEFSTVISMIAYSEGFIQFKGYRPLPGSGSKVSGWYLL